MTHQPALLLDTVLLDRALAERDALRAAHADCSNLSHAEAARIFEEARQMRAERDALCALALRALAALRATLTRRGHLAQTVGHEGLGYCSWRSESERCIAQQTLIDDLAEALEADS